MNTQFACTKIVEKKSFTHCAVGHTDDLWTHCVDDFCDAVNRSVMYVFIYEPLCTIETKRKESALPSAPYQDSFSQALYILQYAIPIT